MDIKFLVENKTETDGIVAEHGLSVYIDTGDKKILFDAGASDAFAMNAERMKVDLAQVDLAVVSHGHCDHTGGFPLFCRINRKAPIYIHKNAFRESHAFSDGRIEDEITGIRWTEEQREGIGSRLIFTDGPVKITDDIIISGTIPVDEEHEPTERFYYYSPTGDLVIDDMSHEQCLVIRRPEGLFVFSGCSHRGVIPALEAARSLVPDTPVALLVAGMHLYSAPDGAAEKLIEELKKDPVEKIMPVHCTGLPALCKIKMEFGDRCVLAMAGDEFRD